MKVGLIDVDGFGKVKKFGSTIYPNIALAKLSAYHKRGGDSVEWYTPFEHYDVVYMSKVFSFTPDYCYIMANADKVVRGGTGYDIKSAFHTGGSAIVNAGRITHRISTHLLNHTETRTATSITFRNGKKTWLLGLTSIKYFN